MTLGMLEILRGGGFTTGGLNFDAKLRRQSIDRTDLFHGHIGGMDTMARALLVAAAILDGGELDANRDARYAGWDGELGRSILDGSDRPAGAARAGLRPRRAGARVRRPGAAREPRRPPRRPTPLCRRTWQIRRASRRRRRLVDHRDQGRGARPRQRPGRRARVGAAPADAAAAVRAGAGGVVGGVRGGVAAGRRAGRRRRSASPASSTGWSRSTSSVEVIRPAKLWNDTESAPDAAWLIDQLPGGRQAWAEACGLVPVASFTITKLSWLHRSEPEAWRRLAHVVLPHDWLTFQLTGRLVTDRGDASGTGYWSAATGELPPRPARRSSTPTGTGRRPCRRCSARARSPASGTARSSAPGTGDNMAGALGVGPALRRRRGVDRDVGHRVHGQRRADRRSVRHRRRVRRRHRPPPPARLHAQRDEGHRRRRAACSASTTSSSTSSRSPRRPAPAASPCCRTSTASARRTGRTRPACSPGCAATSAASSSPGPPSRAWSAGCSTASTRSAAFAPADGRLLRRRRRRPLAGLPPGARRPERAGGARAARRRAGRHRRVRAGGRAWPPAPSRRTSPTTGSSARATSSSRAPATAAAADVRAAYAALRDATAG